MRVKCVICDTVEELDDHILEAKRLRNRPIQTFMCINCHDRIANNTKKRVDSGNFIFRRSSHPVEKAFKKEFGNYPELFFMRSFLWTYRQTCGVHGTQLK